jgi:hypothetical protein
MNVMTKRGSLDNQITYEHYCDTKTDLENIPKNEITLGTVAVVLKDENNEMGIYIADSNKEWNSFSSGGSSAEEIELEELTITENGTYSAGEGKGFSKVEVEVEGSGDFTEYINGTITKIHDSTVTHIRDFAFYKCSMLSDISFPNVETIGENAFSTAIYSSNYNPITDTVDFIDEHIPITSAIFPRCKTIASFAFANCYQLSQISFPECTTIGYGAFQNCHIKEAIFPKCVNLGSAPFNFYGSEESPLETAVFPALSVLSDDIFTHCRNLKTVTLKDCVYINQTAFYECLSLESLYMLGSSMTIMSANNAYVDPLSQTKIPTTGYIYVPASLIDSYKTGFIWSKYSSRFEGLTDEEIAEILEE